WRPAPLPDTAPEQQCRPRGRHRRLDRLAADAESLDEILITRLVARLDVVEQAAAQTDHLEQATTGMVVLGVVAEMLSEVLDPLGENGDLNLRRAGVSVLGGEFLYERALALRGNRHRVLRCCGRLSAGGVAYALGMEPALLHFGKRHRFTAGCDKNRSVKARRVPPAQDHGLASHEAHRVPSPYGQRRDVVQRGLPGA